MIVVMLLYLIIGLLGVMYLVNKLVNKYIILFLSRLLIVILMIEVKWFILSNCEKIVFFILFVVVSGNMMKVIRLVKDVFFIYWFWFRINCLLVISVLILGLIKGMWNIRLIWNGMINVIIRFMYVIIMKIFFFERFSYFSWLMSGMVKCFSLKNVKRVVMSSVCMKIIFLVSVSVVKIRFVVIGGINRVIN